MKKEKLVEYFEEKEIKIVSKISPKIFIT